MKNGRWLRVWLRSIILILTASNKAQYLPNKHRIRSLSTVPFNIQHLVKQIASAGFVLLHVSDNDSSINQHLYCFHCGVKISVESFCSQVSTISNISVKELVRLHARISPNCFYQKLCRVLISDIDDNLTTSVISDADRYYRALKSLRTNLSSGIVSIVSSYGFDKSAIVFCLTRYFMKNQAKFPKKYGDVIEYYYECEEAIPNDVMSSVNIMEFLDEMLPDLLTRTTKPDCNNGNIWPTSLNSNQQSSDYHTQSTSMSNQTESETIHLDSPSSSFNVEQQPTTTKQLSFSNDPQLSQLCIICRSNVKNRVLLPCSCLSVCSTCLEEFQLSNCPVCKKTVFGMLPIYIC